MCESLYQISTILFDGSTRVRDDRATRLFIITRAPFTLGRPCVCCWPYLVMCRAVVCDINLFSRGSLFILLPSPPFFIASFFFFFFLLLTITVVESCFIPPLRAAFTSSTSYLFLFYLLRGPSLPLFSSSLLFLFIKLNDDRIVYQSMNTFDSSFSLSFPFPFKKKEEENTALARMHREWKREETGRVTLCAKGPLIQSRTGKAG